MPEVEVRCTQCGSREFGDPTSNTNKRVVSLARCDVKHGSGREHGTETVYCPTCDAVTVHNRCGKSVPQSKSRV